MTLQRRTEKRMKIIEDLMKNEEEREDYKKERKNRTRSTKTRKRL